MIPEIREKEMSEQQKKTILKGFLYLLGFFIIVAAPIGYSILVEFGRGMATTGCNGRSGCTIRLDDWFKEETVYFVWLPVAVGISCIFGAWKLGKK